MLVSKWLVLSLRFTTFIRIRQRSYGSTRLASQPLTKTAVWGV
jgi:hypothetical protein